MTKQEVFDTVARHLRQQNCQALAEPAPDNRPPSCAYRGKNNTKCAVGCLIPDHLYDFVIEGSAISIDLSSEEADPKRRVLVDILMEAGLWEHKQLLQDLQLIHDGKNHGMPVDWNHWKPRLKRMAMLYNLNTNVVDASETAG